MIWNLKPPAFNYMVPGPHPYIMGQSTSALMHPTLYAAGKASYGAIDRAWMEGIVAQYAPLSTPTTTILADRDRMVGFLSAMELTTEEERGMKGLTPMPSTRQTEGRYLRDDARSIGRKADIIPLIDRMYQLARDEEAIVTGRMIKRVKKITECTLAGRSDCLALANPPIDTNGNGDNTWKLIAGGFALLIAGRIFLKGRS